MSMSNKKRYETLEEATRLIRKVEFSYKEGSPERDVLYHLIAKNFTVLNPEYSWYIQRLRKKAYGW